MQTAGELIIESPIKTGRVLNINMTAKVNNHAKLEFSAETDSEGADSLLKQIDGGEVKLTHKPSGVVIFQGMAESLHTEVAGGYYVLRGYCVSNTKKMDILERRCSFQDADMSYSELVHKVFGKHERSAVVANAGQFRRLGAPIIQYAETDWEFALRMAGNIRTLVVPSYYSDAVNAYFGAPSKVKGQASPLHYDRGRSSLNFIDRKYHHKYVAPRDFEYFRFSDENVYRLGDWINIEGRDYLVVMHEMNLKKGVLEHEYTLTSEDNAIVRYFENEKARGLSLAGTVLDRDYNNLKIHLDIDESQDVEKAYWYPYLPPVGNVMYTMPQIGTRVFLRLKSSGDGDGAVVHCQRTNGQSMSDVSKRYYTTEFGKRFSMLPSLTSMSGKNNLMAEEDGKGISAKTGKDLKMHAGGKIIIKSGKKVTVATPAQIRIVKSDEASELEMSGGEILLKNETINTAAGGGKNIAYPDSDEYPSVEIGADLASALAGAVPLF